MLYSINKTGYIRSNTGLGGFMEDLRGFHWDCIYIYTYTYHDMGVRNKSFAQIPWRYHGKYNFITHKIRGNVHKCAMLAILQTF